MCAFASTLKAQDPHGNFKLVEGKVYWQKIYEVTNIKNVLTYFSSGTFKAQSKDSTSVTGETASSELPFKKNGYTRGWVRMTYLNPCVIYYNIEIKDNKYRVTISNVIWNTSTYYMGTTLTRIVDLTAATVNKKGKYLKSSEKDFEMLNKIFSDIFNAGNDLPKNDNW